MSAAVGAVGVSPLAGSVPPTAPVCGEQTLTPQERYRLNLSTPPREGLARMAQDLFGPTAKVVAVRRLAGGLEASTHAVRVEGADWVVLKRSSGQDPSWLAGEFARLGMARAVPVPTPRPISLDQEGSWFGGPALVTTRLEGQTVFHPQVGAWVDSLAHALAAIHQVGLPEDLPAILRPRHAGLTWKPPDPAVLARTGRVEALIAAAIGLQEELPRRAGEQVLLHHDFHHGNVLWSRGKLTGVVDWSEATTGPPACDVAYCSVDLAMTHGRRASERFRATYQAAATWDLRDLPAWQALWTVNAMRWVGDWMSSFKEVRAPGVSLPRFRRRLRSFANHLMAL